MVLARTRLEHIVPRFPSHQWRAMSIRIRKLIGAVGLLVLVTAWALLAMAIAQFPPIFQNPVVAGLYYFVAGIGWILPAMPLINWMYGKPLMSR